MDTCEETVPPTLQTDDEINLKAQSNGSLEHTHDGDDRGDPEALAQQLETLQLEVEPKEIAANDEDDDDDNGHGSDAENEETHPYPLRPHVTDCTFYIKTGTCKFGPNCRFNHPPRKGNQVAGYKEKELQGSSEHVGKIECKYYFTPAGCKYGDACRYSHSKATTGKEQLELNFMGLPIRPEAKECTFYMRNGSCGYGLDCMFHHPDPVEANEPGPDKSLVDSQPGRGPETYVTQFAPLQSPGLPHSPMPSLPNYADAGHCVSYVPPMNSFPRGMPQNPGWNQYQAPYSQRSSSQNFHSNEPMTNPSNISGFITHHQQQPHVEEFPERPGLPECDYFMKTGNCKYKSACRYHHPRSRSTNSAPDARNNNFSSGVNSFAHQHHPECDDEFPERPGQPECEYFMKTGYCKFKSSCRYHHPRSRSHNSVAYANGLPPRHAPNPKPEPSSWMGDKYANSSSKEKGYRNHHHQQVHGEEFPERPGELDCEYYMKTGNCKYKSACRYNHPKDRMSAILSACAVSAKGLPLRPGSKICRHYEQHGTCRYGQRCLFDHPDEYNSSADPAASASEVPTAYPDAPPESTPQIPATGSPKGNEHGSDGWGDGWVM